MIEGQLIVVEGVDGAGTTTHTKLLCDWFRESGLPVRGTREPSDGPIGLLLRQCLSHRLVVNGVNGPRPPSWTTMALLFAADRADHVDAEILPNLHDGVNIVCDRYYHSSVAYQHLSSGGRASVEWLTQINQHARTPDLTIVLDVAAEETSARRRARGGPEELYEEDEFQTRLVEFYRTLDKHFPKEQIVHVTGDSSVEVVQSRMREAVANLRRGQ